MRGEAAKVAKNVLIKSISNGFRRFAVRYRFMIAQPVLDVVVSLHIPQSTSEQRHLKRTIVALDAREPDRGEIGINRGALGCFLSLIRESIHRYE